MAIETFKSVVRRKAGLAVEIDSRGFKAILDEPTELGGSNTGMNPVEMVLGALGACQVITATAFAPQFGIELEDFHVELEGDLDLDSFTPAQNGIQKGYQNIRFNFHMKSDAPEEKLHAFADVIESICPVGQTILNDVNMMPAKVVISK